MRSIFVWYFIKMKTWGIFYFPRWHFRYLCGTMVKTEESGKWALHTRHSLILYSLHTNQELQCTVSNREPYRGGQSLWNHLCSGLAHCVPSMNRTFVMSGTPKWIKKPVSGKLIYIISDKKNASDEKRLTQLYAWSINLAQFHPTLIIMAAKAHAG